MVTIQEFLDQYDLSTHRQYQYNLKTFFDFIKIEPNRYITTKRDYEKDIENYFKYLKKTYKPLTTRNSKLNVIRVFLEENNITFTKRFWKKLKRSKKDQGNRSATIDRAPTRYELRKIILEGRPIHRAMFLMAASSGMRIGEIIQLTPDDIDLDYNPPMIKIRGEYTKNGESRVTFISNEAKEALLKWYSLRDNWIQTAQKKLSNLKYDWGKDKRIFPLNRSTPCFYWKNMLKRANLNKRDPTTDIHVLHTHTLRKFFRTNLVQSMGLDMVEQLMGHAGYLTGAYRRHSVEDMAKAYLKAMDEIMIIQEPKSLEQFDNKMKEKDQQIQDLKQQLKDLETKIGNYALSELITEVQKLKQKQE